MKDKMKNQWPTSPESTPSFQNDLPCRQLNMCISDQPQLSPDSPTTFLFTGKLSSLYWGTANNEPIRIIHRNTELEEISWIIKSSSLHLQSVLAEGILQIATLNPHKQLPGTISKMLKTPSWFQTFSTAMRTRNILLKIKKPKIFACFLDPRIWGFKKKHHYHGTDSKMIGVRNWNSGNLHVLYRMSP